MPLLFAVTLFASASLLFMVQPMVGKLVLPLLGGSPAVWNACMVFFQALLLLGYLYADRLTRQDSPKRQWVVHMAVMALPVGAFLLAILFNSRHTPIGVAESLAPSDGSSAILSVLAILTFCIGIPFFVVSTSATLLQKWFTYTGHPSARDPYFLYAASNFGSLISLLGYPIFIEPNMTQGAQTWFWAAGFVGLIVLIAFCGRAAVNPLGVPPSLVLATAGANGSAKLTGKPSAIPPKSAVSESRAVPAPPPAEAPPTWLRMAKWTLLAFVPSSLMLGVTFHMTTDIASIPLLWVGPLALYLVTFIIAFGRTPPWFRILIGNLAPVMILLLVFLMISEVRPGTGLELLLYNLTFFAAALMCHYELARDRPSPQFLTTYFLIMSLGGVLGGIFNSLVAPLVFTHAYEFPMALVVACLMVPNLSAPAGDDKSGGPAPEAAGRGANPIARLSRAIDRIPRIGLILDVVLPVLVGVAFWQLQKLPGQYEWYSSMVTGMSDAIGNRITRGTVIIVLTYAVPVMVCFFFVDRPLRFALCVAAILGPVKYREAGASAVHTERSFFGILKIEETANNQYLVDRRLDEIVRVGVITDESIEALRRAEVPESVVQKVLPLQKLPTQKETEWSRQALELELIKVLTPDEFRQYKDGILASVGYKKPLLLGQYEYRRLVHGTTLHGTQVSKHERHILDDFQLLTAMNPWDNLAVLGAIQTFDMRQEPLTYYHRTGPVGAMFSELTRRGKDGAHVAMVGLGTGSASCYAHKDQRLTFYEIDPAVIKLVADTDKYFTYVADARKRQALVDFRIGDARLKLKDTDDKYALLLIDAFSSDSIPVHLLTVEAVALYLERLTDDGILALHISNKFVKLEPVVAAIAEHHGLVARVWNDESEGKHGKTASSWVALARKREDLGDRLCSPIGDLIAKYYNRQLFDVLVNVYPELRGVLDKSWYSLTDRAVDALRAERMPEPLLSGILSLKNKKLQHEGFDRELDKLLAPAEKTFYGDLIKKRSVMAQKEMILMWLDERPASDAQAKEFASWIRKHNSEYVKLMEVLQGETGYGFRPLNAMSKNPPLWTDDYADVMRVMMIPELQTVRKFFGLPTLDDE